MTNLWKVFIVNKQWQRPKTAKKLVRQWPNGKTPSEISFISNCCWKCLTIRSLPTACKTLSKSQLLSRSLVDQPFSHLAACENSLAEIYDLLFSSVYCLWADIFIIQCNNFSVSDGCHLCGVMSVARSLGLSVWQIETDGVTLCFVSPSFGYKNLKLPRSTWNCWLVFLLLCWHVCVAVPAWSVSFRSTFHWRFMFVIVLP